MIPTYLVPVLFTFSIQGVLKFKKNNSGAKRLTSTCTQAHHQQSVLVFFVNTKQSYTFRPLTVTIFRENQYLRAYKRYCNLCPSEIIHPEDEKKDGGRNTQKCDETDLEIQFVPRSKHALPRLYKKKQVC